MPLSSRLFNQTKKSKLSEKLFTPSTPKTFDFKETIQESIKPQIAPVTTFKSQPTITPTIKQSIPQRATELPRGDIKLEQYKAPTKIAGRVIPNIRSGQDLLAQTPIKAGVQKGFADAFGATGREGIIGQNITRQEEKDPTSFKRASYAGRIGGELASYIAAGKIAKSIPAVAKLGETGKFASKLAIDQTIDNIAQAPRGILKDINEDKSIDEITRNLLKQNVIDLAFNIALQGAGDFIQTFRKTADNTGQTIEEVVESVVKNDANRKTIQQELGLPDNFTAADVVAESRKIADDIGAEQYYKSIEETPEQAIKKFQDWRSKNFGGATGKQTPGDLQATKELYLEDTGIDLDATLRDISENIQPTKLSDRLKARETPPQAEIPKLDTIQPQKIASDIEQPSLVTELPTKQIDDTLRTQDGLKERGFSRNIRTDEAIAPEASASFDVNPEFYQELANKTTLEKAQIRFDKGFDEALKDFELTKGEFKADNVVLAKLLANEAAVRGDLNTMRRVLSDTAQTLTTAGQYSQAAKILRESNDPATVLTYLQKELKKLNDQGLKRYGTSKPRLFSKGEKGWKNIELNEEELAKISKFTENTTDAEKEAVFEELFESISKRIPTSNREKFDAWRRIAMLTNPKTHVRNILGNSIMTGVKRFSDTIAAGGEKLIKPELRTKSTFKKKEFKDIASQYWEANKKDLSEGSRWEIFGVKSPFAEKRVFDTEALEAINNFSKATLEGEDIFFLKRHFTDDLAGFMQARGLKEPTQEAVEYALKRAQEATFRQQNALADMIAKGKKSRYGLIVEAAIPFSKTPANIAQMGIDYSPIGVVKSISEMAKNAPPAQFIETMSKGLTGTGLATLGYYMAQNGLARGEYKANNKEEALLGRAGRLPNSIQMKNGSYTIDWAQPAAIPLFMGIAFQEEMAKKDSDGDVLDATWKALVAGGDTIVNQTMLKNIKELFGSYGSTTQKVAELPLNYVTQAFPTVLGQVARSTDPIKRERDYSGIIPKLTTQTQAKIPGLSDKLAPKRGMLGEELSYGKGALNVLQQFLSPGYFSRNKDDAITNELVRLYEEVGEDFLPRARVKSFSKSGTKYELTPQEISNFQKTMGEHTERQLSALFKSGRYNTLDDEAKAKVIKKINDVGYELAKEEIIRSR